MSGAPGWEAQSWEEEARNWIAWARRPGHDSYWGYRSRFFELVPAPGTATLDLGCGEGRVSRDLAGRGHRVVSCDLSAALVQAAREAGPGGRYLRADAAALPFAAGSFDLVVAYNMLMDVADLPGAAAEAGRVLQPGGRLMVAVTHPVVNSGGFRDGPGSPFVIDGPYFESRRYEDIAHRDGLTMTFRGWAHPISAYTRALEDAGLLIEALREPVAYRADGSAHPVPWHLWLRAVRPARRG